MPFQGSDGAEEDAAIENHKAENEEKGEKHKDKIGEGENKSIHLYMPKEYSYINLGDTEIVQDPSTKITSALLRRIISDELERLDGMKPGEIIVKLEELKLLLKRIYKAAEELIRQVVTQITLLTPIFKHLSEFDQRACDKAIEATDEDWENAGISRDDREALMSSLRDRMEESVKINYDFTHKISHIASPLTVWRLASSTAVWAGNNELMHAYQTTRFQLGEAEVKLSKAQGEVDKTDESTEKQTPRVATSAAVEGEILELDRDLKAAEKSKLEAEMYVEGQLDCNEIAESERPPLKEWIKYTYTAREGDEEHVVCYVRAPPDCLVEENRLVCTYVSPHAKLPNLPGNSEVIGNFISIRPQHPKLTCILPNEPWIIGIPLNYGKNPTRDVVVFTTESTISGPKEQLKNDFNENDDPGSSPLPWVEIQTTDAFYDGVRYLECKLMRLPASLLFVPAARIRRDIGEFSLGGGMLTSLIDKRVSMIIPPGGLKITCSYSIQVSISVGVFLSSTSYPSLYR